MHTPTTWRLKTKPASLEQEVRARYIKAMLDDGFIGTGWPLNSSPRDLDDCLNLLAEKYPRKDATAVRFVRDTAIGDLVWIADTARGCFHLCRICSEYYYLKTAEPYGGEAAHRFDVDWLARDLSPEHVPGGVKNALRIGTTYCRIHCHATCRYSERLAGLEVESATSNDFLELLDDQALEDLVGLYLQMELKGALIPSTCKSDTAAYEYVVKSWDGKRSAIAQVKSGKQPITNSLASDDRERYLFAVSGIYPVELHGAIKIEKCSLIDFADSFKDLLPKTVTCWMSTAVSKVVT
ncbi:hypothetical protein [Granulosicoccus antarcticus]|uniref:Uncharacterized protein n=1 Tax=Granulosicoccus antarcticus IMCC3135 TaxID=1192854 RepID=A0A2Z2NQ60_9GAMM|nr:hypothetical protein [Granulosicoccus antarcticus]ASJ72101.1 hypothetical protein IMCC3135_10035 [Granulosicoccus antarcticus IMCC3135]